MNIVAVTKHSALVERLREAYKNDGHRVKVVEDHLQALAQEVWRDAHVLLVDAAGDPMDGFRFSSLLRGESRQLFKSLPILLLFDGPAASVGPDALANADVDGFLTTHDDVARLCTVLDAVTEGALAHEDVAEVPLLAVGFTSAQVARMARTMTHFGFQVVPCLLEDLPVSLAPLRVPILLLGLDPAGTHAFNVLRLVREQHSDPYVIMVGRLPKEGLQRKLLLAGVREWVPTPLSAPLLLHAVRRGLEWHHQRRLQLELHAHIAIMRERRANLEMETTSLRSEVLTDPLTQLLNRRAFNQNLELAVNQWVRHHRPFVLIFGDIDYFKLINDRFGHLVGDEVLKVIAERIRGSLRRSDLAFRLGGEEFAIILMETGLHAGAEVADKLRRRIDENPVHLDTGQSIFPTISFGVGAPVDHDANALCTAVDEALYIAKHKGRNRIEVVPERSPSGGGPISG